MRMEIFVEDCSIYISDQMADFGRNTIASRNSCRPISSLQMDIIRVKYSENTEQRETGA